MLTCQKCGSTEYHIEAAAHWDKAICNDCNYYIKFLPQSKNKSITNKFLTIKSIFMAQGQGFYGSICLDDLLTGKLAKGSNGKTYVCMDDLNIPPFNKGKTNGKTYVNVGVWVNEDNDEFGNCANISLSQSLQDREQQAKKQYIGNLKRSGGVKSAASPVVQPAASIPSMNDLPF